MGYNNTELKPYFKICLPNQCHAASGSRSVPSNINKIQEICPSFSGNACTIESVKLFQLKRISFKYYLQTCPTSYNSGKYYWYIKCLLKFRS